MDYNQIVHRENEDDFLPNSILQQIHQKTNH